MAGDVSVVRGRAEAIPLPDASVDAIVTDPPYGLEFMGQEWDSFRGEAWRAGAGMNTGLEQMRAYQRWCEQWAAECLRVLKPGGWMLAFGGTRTWHRLTCAIEDAGFEIRDSVADLCGQDAPGLMWVYGSGFPKSLDVAKAIDKAAGIDREDKFGGAFSRSAGPTGNKRCDICGKWLVSGSPCRCPRPQDAPVTEDAARWDGWGTALKPAWEPIVVARKPLAGTVVQNVLTHSTGALNIDACKVAYETGGTLASNPSLRTHINGGNGGHVIAHEDKRRVVIPDAEGRWPPNLLLTHAPGCQPAGTRLVRSDGHHPAARGPGGLGTSGHVGQSGLAERKSGAETVEAWDCVPGCPVAELDRQSGVTTSTGGSVRGTALGFVNDDGWQPQVTTAAHFGDKGGASRFFPVFRYTAKAGTAERPRDDDGKSHPTIKPLALIRWLVRLVTPPGGLILDLFAGSGPTGEAAIIHGYRCILMDKDPKSVRWIRKRLSKPIQTDLFGGEL